MKIGNRPPKVRKKKYPSKTSMNLFYKPDRTTKPSTIALYVLFVVVLLLGLSKWMVYDIWIEKVAAERDLEAAQERLLSISLQLTDYNEVEERYIRYSATSEEETTVDRLDALAMLEESVGDAKMYAISISNNQMRTVLSNVTLAQVAEIVNRLESSPLVAGTTVSTASTTGGEGADGDLVQANFTIQLQKPEEGEEAK